MQQPPKLQADSSAMALGTGSGLGNDTDAYEERETIYNDLVAKGVPSDRAKQTADWQFKQRQRTERERRGLPPLIAEQDGVQSYSVKAYTAQGEEVTFGGLPVGVVKVEPTPKPEPIPRFPADAIVRIVTKCCRVGVILMPEVASVALRASLTSCPRCGRVVAVREAADVLATSFRYGSPPGSELELPEPEVKRARLALGEDV